MATTAISSSTATTSAATSSTAKTTTTTAAQDTAAANRSAAQKLISSLGAGSGVDVASLAQNLVDAERIPQENAINAKITKNESRISGYAAVSYVLSQVQTALTDLKDQNSFNSLAVDNTASSAFNATAGAKAVPADHDIDVLSLSKAQRTASNGFSSQTQSLNGGKAINFALTIGSGDSAVTSTIALADGQDNPQALVQAINAAGKGVKAQLVDTGVAGNPYKVVLTGEQGAAKQFTLTPQYSLGGVGAHDAPMNSGNPINVRLTLSTGEVATLNVTDDTPDGLVAAIHNQLGLKAQLVANPAGSAFANKIFITGPDGNPSGFKVEADYDGSGYQTLVQPSSFSLTNNQSASDAQVRVDGVTYTRTSNSLSDVITGVTLDLKTVTSSTAKVSLTRDTTALKTKMEAVVTAYNDAMTIFTEVSNPKSTLDTYGATLVGDSTVRSLRQQLREMLTKTSSTPGTSVGALWQVGFSINEKGVMSLDSTKLDKALTDNFSDVVKTFTGNQNGLTAFSPQAGGIAGDAARKLTTILGSTGILVTQTGNAEKQNTGYKDDLTKLQTRMDALLVRYQKQLASMESLVGSVNSQKTSLKSSFDGMMSMYTGKSG